MLGSMVPRSRSTVSLNVGCGLSSVRNRPCSLVYRSTSSTCAALRPVALRNFRVSSSTGKKPIVAPYSGDILAMVARSAKPSLLMPGP